MTLTQLEYVIAVDKYRHFAEAAASCFVTQPTLSMQIQKLEEELGFKIFDRSKQPVIPAEQGVDIIEQARKIIAERDALTEIIQSKKGILKGEFKLGIIPTLAPYLLPLFIHTFTKKYPQIKLQINELTTSNLITHLKEGKIDAGILVTPLNENGIEEEPLFYEEMIAYISKTNEIYKKQYILPKDIDPKKLWLLEEGHCFRSQILYLCQLLEKQHQEASIDYEAGNLETLRKMVDLYGGITVLPELATMDMLPKQIAQLRNFKHPIPVREVSLVVHRTFVKRRLIESLKHIIVENLPEKIKKNKKAQIIPIN